jgi:ribosomal protein S27AE
MSWGEPLAVMSDGKVAAGVVLNPRGAWTFGVWDPNGPPRGTIVLDGYRPERMHGPDWYAVGGRAPDRAAAVVVRTGAGDWEPGEVSAGAWVVLVHEQPATYGLPPVRWLDGDGEMVFPPRLRRHARCPQCGKDTWVQAADPEAPMVCGTCGYSDEAGRTIPGRRT